MIAHRQAPLQPEAQKQKGHEDDKAFDSFRPLFSRLRMVFLSSASSARSWYHRLIKRAQKKSVHSTGNLCQSF
jgi:hypothetical protein